MKSLADVYNNIPKENLEKLKKLRKKEIITSKLDLLVLLLFLIATIINFYIAKHVMICEMIILFATYGLSRLYEATSFREDYDRYIIKPLVESYNEEIIYDIDNKMSEKDYAEAGYSLGDEFYSNNYFETKDKTIRASNLAVISKHTDSDGETHYKTLFSGIYSIITLDNYSEYTIKMSTDGKLKDLIYISNKRRIEVDSAKFEENFDLFCENRVYAMEIFTSEILNSIMALSEKDKTKYDFILENNKLYVRYYNDKFYNVNFKKNVEMKNLEEMYENIYKLLDLLTILQKNMNEKLSEIHSK